MNLPKDVAGAKADYSMALPRLPAPASTHYSGMSYDVPQAVPSPTTANFSPQPRARDMGNLAVPKPGAGIDGMHGSSPQAPSSAPPTPAKPNLPRAPPAMTHRRSHSLSQRPSTGNMLKGIGSMLTGGKHHQAPATAGPETTTFAEKMGGTDEKEPIADSIALNDKENTQQEAQETDHEQGVGSHIPGATLVRRFGTLLGGARGDEGKRSKRSSILIGLSPRPSRDDGDSDKRSRSREDTVQNEKSIEKERNGSITHSSSQPVGTIHRRAATILDPAGRAARHERRSSTGAAFFSAAGGTMGRHRRPSTSAGGPSTPSKNTGVFERTAEEEEHDLEGDDMMPENEVDGQDDQDRGTDKEFKPVFLKGLFR